MKVAGVNCKTSGRSGGTSRRFIMPPRRLLSLVSGEHYHIYNRGANTNPIFFRRDHYLYCLRLLRKYSDRYNVTIFAFCLMPNHYHLLLRQEAEGSISNMVGTVFNAYVQIINSERKRSGTLFEGRFKHIHVDRDDYILQLCRYIHLNPVKAGLTVTPEQWPFSDCRQWLSNASNKDFIPEKFDYANFLKDGAESLDEKYTFGT